MTEKEFKTYLQNSQPSTKEQRLIGYNENLKRLNEARKQAGLNPVNSLD